MTKKNLGSRNAGENSIQYIHGVHRVHVYGAREPFPVDSCAHNKTIFFFILKVKKVKFSFGDFFDHYSSFFQGTE